jgi:SAM-dependent methyltransferase
MKISDSNCPICGTTGNLSFSKNGIDYIPCPKCLAVYTTTQIPKELIITENDSDVARNQWQINWERLRRIEERHNPKKVLDFGCGNGQMTDLINDEKIYNCCGIDQHTNLKLADIDQNSIDTIIMTEVIEHIYNPIYLFNRLYDLLSSPGIIYIESSFVDYLGDYNTSGYIDPKIGHCLIHSKKSIEELAKQTGFRVSWYSQNVVFFIK